MKKNILAIALSAAVLLPSATYAADQADLTKAVVKLIKAYNDLEMRVGAAPQGTRVSSDALRDDLRRTNDKLDRLILKINDLEQRVGQGSAAPHQNSSSMKDDGINIKTTTTKPSNNSALTYEQWKEKQPPVTPKSGAVVTPKSKSPVTPKASNKVVTPKKKPAEPKFQTCEEELKALKKDISLCREKNKANAAPSETNSDKIIMDFLKDNR